MTTEWFTQLLLNTPPGLWLAAGGLLMAGLGTSLRGVVALTLPLALLYLIWWMPEGHTVSSGFLGYALTPIEITRLGRLFATVFLIMAFCGGLYAFRYASKLELSAAFVYAGSALLVVLSGDLITLLIGWELMAIGSTLVIWSAGGDAAYAAARRYISIHLLGGVLLMAGVIGHIHTQGTTSFSAMHADSLYSMLILAGFLVNAGAPPLGSWIGDAYPEASPSGMVFLSAFTTKTAVYALLRGFPGEEILIFVGLFMVFYGIIYALLENDMRRILAYSIVNQVGFMVTAAGIGTDMAINGAAAHAFCHIIYKALLLMSAGSVLAQTGKRRCTDLGGLWHSMPLTATCGIIGALAISAVPWTSGFISKSMISQAAADQHLAMVWMLLAAASAGVFLHAGIKFPWFVFFQKDSGLRPTEPAWDRKLAMLLFSAACIGLGIMPGPLYAILPFPVDYVPYTASHVVSQLQLLLFAGLAFFVMLPQLQRTLTISLDLDWFYRRLGADMVAGVREVYLRSEQLAALITGKTGQWVVAGIARGRPAVGNLGTGAMASAVLLLFGIYLLIFY